jgi:hypothetical protein
VSLIGQYRNDRFETIRDYRAILNCEWKFGGKGR